MAGHSQFKNIMHRKNAQDKHKAKIFTRMAKLVTVAAKKGDIYLEAAIREAKAVNMPKTNIENAIARASLQHDKGRLEEITYEGFGPGGEALIIETLTDNHTRTAAEMRSFLLKQGGRLGVSNSVMFLFEQLGFLFYPLPSAEEENIHEDLILEACLIEGVKDVIIDESIEVFTLPNQLFNVSQLLNKTNLTCFKHPQVIKQIYKAVDPIAANKNIENLIDKLWDNDDVKEIYTNVALSDISVT